MKQETSSSWSWLATPEELKKQVEEYDTLKITESYRGVTVLVMSALLVLSLVLGYFEVTNLDDVILSLFIYIPLLFFVYRGHKWAIITLLLLWTLEKVFTLIISVENGGSPVSSVIWFLIVAPLIFKAYLVEREKGRVETPIEFNQGDGSFKYCSQCGAKISREANFCNSCGAKLVS